MKRILITLIILFNSCFIFAQNNKVVIDSNYKCSCNIDTCDGFTVLTFVEKMPEYNGGLEALSKFLHDNISFSGFEDEYMTQSYYITFIVDTSGSVTNICAYRRTYSMSEFAIMKVVATMPKWIPGEQNGVRVPVRYNLPIKF